MPRKLFKAVIIDDEQDNLDLLGILLKEECPEIDVVARCLGAEQGIRAIQEHAPDVVFLDIVMPEMTGLQLIQHIGKASFYPVFTTAYSQYAINAIKLGAFDYLLKPIRRDELRLLVGRLTEHSTENDNKLNTESLRNLLANMIPAYAKATRITIQEGDQYHFMHLNEIQHLQAQGNYTRFQMTDGRSMLIAKTLGHFCDILEMHGFFRPHASYLVNLTRVNSYVKGTYGRLEMRNGETIPVSRSRKELLLSKI